MWLEHQPPQKTKTENKNPQKKPYFHNASEKSINQLLTPTKKMKHMIMTTIHMIVQNKSQVYFWHATIENKLRIIYLTHVF